MRYILITFFLSTSVLLNAQELQWIGDPSDFLPPGDITLSFSDTQCTNDYDLCMWKGQLEGESQEEFWIWELVEDVHYGGGCDIRVEYSHLPCSDAIARPDISLQYPPPTLVEALINSVLTTEVCVTIKDNCDSAELEYCWNVTVQCGSCGAQGNIYCETCQDADILVSDGGCKFCDPVGLLEGYYSCTPSCDYPDCPALGTPQPPSLCDAPGFVPQNMSWFSFIATAEEIEIEVFAFNCSGAGLQSGIYSSCDFSEPCVGFNVRCIDNPMDYSVDTEVGQTYYMFVDGCNGSECEFEIIANELEPLILDEIDAITAYSLCSGSMLTDDFVPEAAATGMCGLADRVVVCPGESVQFGAVHQGNNGILSDYNDPCDTYYPGLDATFHWTTAWGESFDFNPSDEDSDQLIPVLNCPLVVGEYNICLEYIVTECYPVYGPVCLTVEVREGLFSDFYADVDGDGYGAGSPMALTCGGLDGYVCNNSDCNDMDASVYPGAQEICNGIDSNCDGFAEMPLQAPLVTCLEVGIDYIDFSWLPVEGGDQYEVTIIQDDTITSEITTRFKIYSVTGLQEGQRVEIIVTALSRSGLCSPSTTFHTCITSLCEQFPPLSFLPCDEGDGFVTFNWNPISGIDLYSVNLDGSVIETSETFFTVEGLGPFEPVDLIVTPIHPILGCENLPQEFSCVSLDDFIDQDGDGIPADQDCDDTDPNNYPGNTEICDNADNNCDGQIDEGVAKQTYYVDADMDGYGEEGSGIEECDQPPGTSVLAGDCDDTDPMINPAAPELPNNTVDENCDGEILIIDLDMDGWNSDLDCDDTNAAINPAATEIPNNGIDEDCDGMDGTVSVEDTSQGLVSLYPNPVQDYLYIDSELDLDRVIVYSTDGSLVLACQYNGKKLDLYNLERGVYFLEFVSTNGLTIGGQKIVKL